VAVFGLDVRSRFTGRRRDGEVREAENAFFDSEDRIEKYSPRGRRRAGWALRRRAAARAERQSGLRPSGGGRKREPPILSSRISPPPCESRRVSPRAHQHDSSPRRRHRSFCKKAALRQPKMCGVRQTGTFTEPCPGGPRETDGPARPNQKYSRNLSATLLEQEMSAVSLDRAGCWGEKTAGFKPQP
jgi:hypothetical protein